MSENQTKLRCGHTEQEHEQYNIVSCYTDSMAVEDGYLVQLDRGSPHRATRAVFDYLAQHTPLDAQPPADWPVTLLAWFRSATLPDGVKRDIRALSLALGAIGVFGDRARQVYEQNIGGGILALYAIEDTGGTVAGLTDSAKAVEDTRNAAGNHRTLWLLPNEQGGLTLMLPEDY